MHIRGTTVVQPSGICDFLGRSCENEHIRLIFGGGPLMYWVRAWAVSRQYAVPIPVAACYYLATTKQNNNITRGKPLSPQKIISRGEIQGVKNSPKWGLAKFPQLKHVDS